MVPSNSNEDKKLYNEFINGNMQSLEELVMRYKTNLIYFIYKYVRSLEVAEDIFQDIVVYLITKKEIYNSNYSFKTFLYTIAKSRALNYIKSQDRIACNIDDEKDIFVEEKLLEDIIFSKERKEKIKNVLNKLSNDYQMAIYLTVIEDLSYEETGKIMNKTVSQVKNLVHRAKIKARKLLIEERVVEMKNNKIIRLLLIIIVVGVISSGVVYATNRILKNMKGKADITPTFTSELSTMDSNKVWVGTFNLVWNDFMGEVIKGPIEFVDGYSKMADELNRQNFKVDQLSDNSYFKINGESSLKLKQKIENGIKEKFNENSKILDKVAWERPNSYVLYAMLKKEFNYLEQFPSLQPRKFGDSEELVKYFGTNGTTEQTANKNVEVLFYNSKEDFAVKLKTKEGEEIILYRTTGEGKSFEKNYEEILEEQEKYNGEKNLTSKDSIMIPFINVHNEINYDELCGRTIKGTDGLYIVQALQTIDFELNEKGGSVKSEALIEATKQSILETGKEFHFNDDFILYMKEANKEKPYFALKVDNTDVLVQYENN